MSDNDTPMARIMGRWPGDEADAEIEKELAELQPRESMSQRNLREELRQLQKVSPDCGVVYNGKSAEEWYTLYCQEVRPNDDITNEIVNSVTSWGKHFGIDTSGVNSDRHTPIWQQIYGLLTKMFMDDEDAKHGLTDDELRLASAAPELLQACRLVLVAIEQADLGGEVLWINRGSPVHESASERLADVIELATGKSI